MYRSPDSDLRAKSLVINEAFFVFIHSFDAVVPDLVGSGDTWWEFYPPGDSVRRQFGALRVGCGRCVYMYVHQLQVSHRGLYIHTQIHEHIHTYIRCSRKGRKKKKQKKRCSLGEREKGRKVPVQLCSTCVDISKTACIPWPSEIEIEIERQIERKRDVVVVVDRISDR